MLWSQIIEALTGVISEAVWTLRIGLFLLRHELRARRVPSVWSRLFQVAALVVAYLQRFQIRNPHNQAVALTDAAARTQEIHAHASAGERIADAVAAGMGSWRFIIIQTAFVLLWMACNVVGFVAHWDTYPFILLNLLFSTQAAYAAPIIMMSQNRQAAKDRIRDDQEASEVDVMTRQLALLETINRQQLAILEALHQPTTAASSASHAASDALAHPADAAGQ